VALFVVLCGCGEVRDPSLVPVALPGMPERVHLGEPQVCASPTSGWGRFSEEGEVRGLTDVIHDPLEVFGQYVEGRGGMVVAQDLDADGDIDLVIGQVDDGPMVYTNDGSGHFERNITGLASPFSAASGVWALAVLDLDDDLLPEIVAISGGMVAAYQNLGAGGFGPASFLVAEGMTEGQVYLTANFGDVDGDGDLDLLLPGTGALDGEEGVDSEYGGPDRIYLNDGGSYSLGHELIVEGAGSKTQVALLTDRDADGDLDVYIPADRGPRSAFWRNDGTSGGALSFVNDAEETWSDLEMAAMGIDVADLNGDGLLDYCMSDVGPPKCILSDGQGAYFEAAEAMGLVPRALVRHYGTIGWSVDIADMDNDGWLDVLQASGPDVGATSDGLTTFMDLFWAGQEDGTFRDVTRATGFGHEGPHFGLATADFDGDGSLDVVVAGPGAPPLLYMNTCGEGHWLGVDLVGPPGNPEGFGARLEAEVDGRLHMRELTNLRAQGQTPSRFHLGLGEAEQVDQLTVHWPDGAVTRAQSVPVDRLLTIQHPDSVAWEPGEDADRWTGVDVNEGTADFAVQGFVFEAQTGGGLEGAEVHALQDQLVTTTSGSAGAYTLPVSEGADVDIVAMATGMVPVIASIQTSWQTSSADGLSHALMSQGSLVGFYAMGGMSLDEEAGTLWVQVIDDFHANLQGAMVDIDADFDVVGSFTGSAFEPTNEFDEDTLFLVFGNVAAGEVGITVTPPTAGATCVGRSQVPVVAGQITTVLMLCPGE